MKATNIAASELVDLMHKQRPTVYWEIGREALTHVRQLADDAGRYLMGPGRIANETTLLGYPIQVVPGDGVILITLVRKGVNVVQAFEK